MLLGDDSGVVSDSGVASDSGASSLHLLVCMRRDSGLPVVVVSGCGTAHAPEAGEATTAEVDDQKLEQQEALQLLRIVAT